MTPSLAGPGSIINAHFHTIELDHYEGTNGSSDQRKEQRKDKELRNGQKKPFLVADTQLYKPLFGPSVRPPVRRLQSHFLSFSASAHPSATNAAVYTALFTFSVASAIKNGKFIWLSSLKHLQCCSPIQGNKRLCPFVLLLTFHYIIWAGAVTSKTTKTRDGGTHRKTDRQTDRWTDRRTKIPRDRPRKRGGVAYCAKKKLMMEEAWSRITRPDTQPILSHLRVPISEFRVPSFY